MPRTCTYGYEAEFDVNATSVMQRLHELDLAQSDHLHSYHCDCDNCMFRNGYPFRGQTDSSCSGEIISDIMGESEDWELAYANPYEHMQALCQAAVDMDAEPGPRSGFHVHVGITGLDAQQLGNSFYEFLRWEPTLQRLAAGRWQAMRANNDHVRDLMNYEWEMITGEPMSNRSMTRHTLGEAPRHRLWQAHRGNDRHTNLNVGARRAVTWEFRLWNSTRAAWRMEMYCEMSKAFMDPDFIAVLATLDPPQRFRRVSAGLNLLAEAADRSGYATLPEHILRQAYYLEEKAEHAPQQLTIG